MSKVIFQRAKCIGCNYCVEHAPQRWRMSLKDGKANLLGGIERREFFITEIPSHEIGSIEKAKQRCPVKIIKLER